MTTHTTLFRTIGFYDGMRFLRSITNPPFDTTLTFVCEGIPPDSSDESKYQIACTVRTIIPHSAATLKYTHGMNRFHVDYHQYAPRSRQGHEDASRKEVGIDRLLSGGRIHQIRFETNAGPQSTLGRVEFEIMQKTLLPALEISRYFLYSGHLWVTDPSRQVGGKELLLETVNDELECRVRQCDPTDTDVLALFEPKLANQKV